MSAGNGRLAKYSGKLRSDTRMKTYRKNEEMLEHASNAVNSRARWKRVGGISFTGDARKRLTGSRLHK